MVDIKAVLDEDLNLIKDENVLLRSNNSLGHGIMDNICHVVYVKSDNFRSSNNSLIAREIEKINRMFTERGENYILVGPGRWGSSDTALGIPVKWPHISNSKLIVEMALAGYHIEPSQGTHFFQNLTSFGVGYFTINPSSKGCLFDEEYLNRLNAEQETDFLRVVRFERPVIVLSLIHI